MVTQVEILFYIHRANHKDFGPRGEANDLAGKCQARGIRSRLGGFLLRRIALTHFFFEEPENFAERLESGHLFHVHFAGGKGGPGALLQAAENLDALDGVNAQISLHVQVKTQHLARVSGLVADNRDEKFFQLRRRKSIRLFSRRLRRRDRRRSGGGGNDRSGFG